MQQPSSNPTTATELITRMNYRKHKQKLNEIKHNSQHHNTSLQFYSSSKHRPVDRKKLLMMKIKREEIEIENKNLRKKIERINGNTSVDETHQSKTVQANRKASHSMANYHPQIVSGNKKSDRYAQDASADERDRIEVISDCGDGDNIRCVIPVLKNKIRYGATSTSQSRASDYNAIIFNLRQKQQKKLQLPRPSTELQGQIAPPSINQNPQSHGLHSSAHPSNAQMHSDPSRLKNLIRQSTPLVKNMQQLIFEEPQKQAHRLVLFKKTKIPMPLVSFLIEISLIDRQLLITAYGMGVLTRDYKLIISKKKSKMIMDEYRGRWDRFWEKIQVDQGGIKIIGDSEVDDLLNDQSNVQQQPLTETEKQKIKQQKRYEITQDFLQRNYYTLMKQVQTDKQKQKDKQKQVEQQNNIDLSNKNNNNTVSQPKVQRVGLQNYMNPTVASSGSAVIPISISTKPKSLFRNKIEYKKQYNADDSNPQTNNNNVVKQQKQKSQQNRIKGVETKKENKLVVPQHQPKQQKVRHETKRTQTQKSSNNIVSDHKDKNKVKPSSEKQVQQPNQLKSKQKSKQKQMEKPDKANNKTQSKQLVDNNSNQYEQQFEQELEQQKSQPVMLQQNYSQSYEPIEMQASNNNDQNNKSNNNNINNSSNFSKQSKQRPKHNNNNKSNIDNMSKVKNNKSQLIDQYELSFEQNQAIDLEYDQDYENQSKVISNKAVKKKTINNNNSSAVDESIGDQIEESVPKDSKNNGKNISKNNQEGKKDRVVSRNDEVEEDYAEQFDN